MKILKSIILLSLIANSYATSLTAEQKFYQSQAKEYQKLADKYQNMSDQFRAKSPLKETKTVSSTESIKASEKTSDGVIATKPIVPAYNPWSGTNASAGGTYNTGNSGGSTFNSGLLLSYSPTPAKNYGWLFTLNNSYQYTQTNKDGSTANKFVLTQKTNYMFNEYNGIFSNIIYTNDKFDTYKYQTQENIGYTCLLYKNANDSMNLILNSGPGFLQTRESSNNEFKNAPSWFTLFTYTWNMTPDTTFRQTAQNTLASTNTNTTLVSAITTTLYKKLALQTSFQWSYDSKVATDKYGVNTLTKMSLIYNF